MKQNELGGYVVRQSDLSSWSRCNLQKHYYDLAASDPDMPQPEVLSATAFGTVMHYALMVMERLHYEGREDALSISLATLEKYWHPDNIDQIAAQVTHWLPRQTYGGLLQRGREALRTYYAVLQKQNNRLLALEYQFAVPLVVDGVTHTLTGTIDRLTIAYFKTKPYIGIDDFKTGKQPTYLRYNMQGTAYSYATMQREFWAGPTPGLTDLVLEPFDESVRFGLERYFDSWGYSLLPEGPKPTASRRFKWINMQDVKFADAGWRTERDYVRLKQAVGAFIKANEQGIYMPTLTGEICIYCPFRDVCGGVGLPAESAGAPA